MLLLYTVPELPLLLHLAASLSPHLDCAFTLGWLLALHFDIGVFGLEFGIDATSLVIVRAFSARLALSLLILHASPTLGKEGFDSGDAPWSRLDFGVGRAAHVVDRRGEHLL